MEYLAIGMTSSYDTVMLLPKWVLYLVTGALGSLMIGLLHRGTADTTPAATPKVVVSAPAESSTTTVTASPKTIKRAATKSKKNGKK